MEKDIGTVLQLHPLGEAGLIVSWCTSQHGIIRTAARNARKPGSDFCGRLDLFHECELLFRPAPRGSDLHTLTSIELLNPRLQLRRHLVKLQLCSYIAKLLLATVETDSHDGAWHTLISGAFDYIATETPRAAILHHFEKRLASLHGILASDTPAHFSLLRHFQHLPSGREEILRQLNSN